MYLLDKTIKENFQRLKENKTTMPEDLTKAVKTRDN